MATLYELTDDYRQLLDMLEDDTIDQEVLADTLEAVGGEIEVKAEGCAKIIRELEGSVDTISNEIARLQERKSVKLNNIQRIKSYLELAMIETGKKKFKTDLFGFNIQKNPPSVIIDNEEGIPEEYWVEQAPKLDKTALKKWLKENREDFAHLEQSESLRIR